MRIRTTCTLVALAIVLFACGSAVAGTSDDPEVSDGTLDATGPANAYADLAKGWLEQTDDVVTAHIEVARIDALQPGIAYIMTFEANGSAYYVGLINFDTIQYFTGGWDADAHAPKAADDATGTFKAGAPAEITIDFAPDTFGKNVMTLEKVGLEAIDFKVGFTNAAYIPLDVAVGDNMFEVMSAEASPVGTESTEETPPPANVPLPIWGPVLAVLGAAAFSRRRK